MDNLPARRDRGVERRRHRGGARQERERRRTGAIVLIPVVVFGAAVACFALSLVMLASVLWTLAVVLAVLSAVSFVAMPLLMMRQRDRRYFDEF